MSSKCSSGQRGEESLGTEHCRPAGNREREREMATLGAVVASSQYTQPVAILRNYTKTDWLATPAQPQNNQPTPTGG